MSLRAAFHYEAVNNAGIKALIADRLYAAGAVPTGTTMPYATFQKISNTHVGHQGDVSGLAQQRIQVDIYAATAAAVEAVYDAFRSKFDHYSGDMGETGSTVAVKIVRLEGDHEAHEAPSDASQSVTFRQTLDFLIWHRE